MHYLKLSSLNKLDLVTNALLGNTDLDEAGKFAKNCTLFLDVKQDERPLYKCHRAAIVFSEINVIL